MSDELKDVPVILTRVRRAEGASRCLVPLSRTQREACQEAVQYGLLVMPMRSMFARKSYWERLTIKEQVLHCMRTLQMQHPRWVFTGPSAALVYGLEVPEEYLWPIRVSVERGESLGRTHTLAKLTFRGAESFVVDHLRVTSLERATFDCLREMDFVDALALADSALRIGALRRDQLTVRMNALRNTSKGGRHAMEVVEYADGRARCVEESRARAVVISQGYVAPDANADGNGALGWHLPDGTQVLVDTADVLARTDDLDELESWLDELGAPRSATGVPVWVGKPYRPAMLNRAS